MSPGGSEFHENRRKVSWPHKKITEVDGRSPGYTESLRELTEGHVVNRGLKFQKVSRPHGKSTEFYGCPGGKDS